MSNSAVDSVSSISPSALQPLLGSNPCLIDVRTGPEYEAAHLPGTRLVPLDQLDPAALLKDYGASEPVYVLCQSGARAAKAAEKLRKAGFERCVVVDGGTQGCIDAGLPVVRGESKVIPIMRQVQITVGLISAVGAGLAIGVDARYAAIPLAIGCGLLFAGLTGTCALAILLAKMPWNRKPCCSGSCCGK